MVRARAWTATNSENQERTARARTWAVTNSENQERATANDTSRGKRKRNNDGAEVTFSLISPLYRNFGNVWSMDSIILFDQAQGAIPGIFTPSTPKRTLYPDHVPRCSLRPAIWVRAVPERVFIPYKAHSFVQTD